METRYSGATWRPLGTQTEPLIGTPRVLIFHTMVGGLLGTDSMFRRNEYTGTESHFGVGGPADGPSLDGDVWQWQSIDRQADAQNAGNAYATSVETSDGGDPNRPWSARQLQALTKLGAWWCRQTGARPRLVESVLEVGFGYHCQFRPWNPNGHTCPNPTRIKQLREIVIPSVAAALTPTTHIPVQVEPIGIVVKAPLRRVLRLKAPLMHGADVRNVQKALGLKGDQLDGWYGTGTAAAVRAFQRRHRLAIDGVVGEHTATALGLRWQAGGVSA